MSDKIRILIVDDIPDTADHISRLISFEPDMEIVGVAATGEQALALAREAAPDVVLMDINMPDVDGIEITERMTRDMPATAIVMMSVQGEPEYLRRSMLAGARAYLIKPFVSDELFDSIRGVFSRRATSAGPLVPVGPGPAGAGDGGSMPHIVAVFAPKGGVGTTTLAVNLAMAASQMGKSVALVDADLQFGDVGVMVDLDPNKSNLGDLVTDLTQGNTEVLETGTLSHRSGVDVLLAPPTPDSAELVSPEIMRTTLEWLAERHNVVIVDCASYLNDTTLAVLDMADQIVCPVSLEITAIRSARAFVNVAEQLGYGDTKLNFVVNRADSNHGIRLEDVERSIGHKVDHMVVSDGRAAVHALNHGIPFVIGNSKARVSQDVVGVAESLFGEKEEVRPPEESKPREERRLAFARR